MSTLHQATRSVETAQRERARAEMDALSPNLTEGSALYRRLWTIQLRFNVKKRTRGRYFSGLTLRSKRSAAAAAISSPLT